MRIATTTFLALAFFSACAMAFDDDGSVRGSDITLTYTAGSSHKLYQINGDCDWVEWDATINKPKPTCDKTVSQTASKADVLGNGLGASFEHKGETIFLFGDTIGATTGGADGPAYYPKWINFPNTFRWLAGDPIARSFTRRAEDGLNLDFFQDVSGTHGLLVQPPGIDMGPDNIPNAGISIDGQIYIVCSTGTVITGGVANYAGNYSVLAKFDEINQTFSTGRTISRVSDGGHFIYMGLHEAPPGFVGDPDLDFKEPDVVMFGLGSYRNSNIYLSVIPKSQFESGVDEKGKNATRYFTGLNHGQPTWSKDETDAVPVVTDLDPANPTTGNFSATYSRELGLWLMTFDGGRNSLDTTGFYFTYAPNPWGPWSTPQLIFNDCRDNASGNYIFYYSKTKAENNCPTALPAGTNTFPAHAGPAGPMIGTNDPNTSRGGAFAPQMIERFTDVDDDTLKIYYNLSTWNPYAVVLMESDFKIGREH
jgi:hypothetical protein